MSSIGTSAASTASEAAPSASTSALAQSAMPDFHFPFTPYPQQLHLMKAIHDGLAGGKVGIFESPTGTGKSLSIICGALTWLFQEERRILQDVEGSITFEPETAVSTSLDDWLGLGSSGGAQAQAQDALDDKRDAYFSYLEWVAQMKASRTRTGRSPPRKVPFRPSTVSNGQSPSSSSKVARLLAAAHFDEEDVEHILDDYDSDSAASHRSGRRGKGKGGSTDASTGAGGGSDNEDGDDDESFMESLSIPQIIYCSRTHSQLSQFVAEIKKTSFAASCRCVVLASRKSLCINSDVTKLKDDAAISETCLEKQRKGVAPTSASAGASAATKKPRKSPSSLTTTKCPYRNRGLDETYSENALNAVRDLEDLVEVGHRLEACPYYGGRRAARYAHVLCVPYNMLVNKELRSSLGVRLRGNVVIMDEAHNISEAVCDSHSASLTATDLRAAGTGIAAYVERYGDVLGGKNLVYIGLLRTVVDELREFLLRHAMIVRVDERQSVFTPNEFLFRTRLDNINFLKLKRFLNTTKIVAKIGGFATGQRRRILAQRAAAQDTNTAASSRGQVTASGDGAHEVLEECTGSLRRIISFVTCLTNPEDQGKVIVSLGSPDDAEEGEGGTRASTHGKPHGRTIGELENASLQFIMLDASSPFKDIVASARSVLLLGGTMKPFSHVVRALLPSVPPHRLVTESFGHIIDPSRVLPVTLGTGVMGTELSFNFAKKRNVDMIIDTGETLLRLVQTVPCGMVCFFTSYDYMEKALEQWRVSGRPTSIYSRIDAAKRIFVESRRKAATDGGPDIWDMYRSTVLDQQKGAILFCVINGKLSEGINFSDDLARCVAIVGLPYPNRTSCVLNEKLDFAEKSQRISPNEVYQLMCMKAVNQSIGRSIRHARDYAAIVLMDSRYRDDAHVAALLPQWISSGLQHPPSAEILLQRLTAFYAQHRTPQEAQT